MNSFIMILSRIYGMTLGRISLLSFWMRKVLVFFFIKRARCKYVAATRYFDWKEFEKQKIF
jgi:hypothetical protein